MDSKVIQRVTPEQREKVLDIPSFMNTEETPVDLGEVESAILNNVPGNTQIEEINHLNELESVCQNWKVEEWTRVLYHAPFSMMCDEIKRRGSGYIEFRNALKDADSIMKKINL